MHVVQVVGGAVFASVCILLNYNAVTHIPLSAAFSALLLSIVSHCLSYANIPAPCDDDCLGGILSCAVHLRVLPHVVHLRP